MGEMEEEGKDQYMSSAMAAIQRYRLAYGRFVFVGSRKRPGTNCYTCFRASIDKLRKDNLTLKEELYLENKFSITPLDSAASHRITAMQDEADALTRKVSRTFKTATQPEKHKLWP